jgi:hypothetical protein
LESGFGDYNGILIANLRRYMQYVRGEENRPITRLEDCRSFVSLIDSAFLSSQRIEPLLNLHSGCSTLLERFVQEGVWPTEDVLASVDPRRLGDLDATFHSLFDRQAS